jgi:sec-independent protein translocase protein TatA
MTFLFAIEPVLAFGFPGGIEMFIVMGVILLLFGSARLPSLMRNLGRSAVEFKKGVHGIEEDVDQAASDTSSESAKESVKESTQESTQESTESAEETTE